MNEETAAPQAAGSITQADIWEALKALDLVYGDEYAFGHDPAVGFWVRRLGTVRFRLTAADPKELGVFLADDIRARQ